MASAPKDIGILLLPSFTHLALGAVVEPLFIANWLSATKSFFAMAAPSNAACSWSVFSRST